MDIEDTVVLFQVRDKTVSVGRKEVAFQNLNLSFQRLSQGLQLKVVEISNLGRYVAFGAYH